MLQDKPSRGWQSQVWFYFQIARSLDSESSWWCSFSAPSLTDSTSQVHEPPPARAPLHPHGDHCFTVARAFQPRLPDCNHSDFQIKCQCDNSPDPASRIRGPSGEVLWVTKYHLLFSEKPPLERNGLTRHRAVGRP